MSSGPVTCIESSSPALRLLRTAKYCFATAYHRSKCASPRDQITYRGPPTRSTSAHRDLSEKGLEGRLAAANTAFAAPAGWRTSSRWVNKTDAAGKALPGSGLCDPRRTRAAGAHGCAARCLARRFVLQASQHMGLPSQPFIVVKRGCSLCCSLNKGLWLEAWSTACCVCPARNVFRNHAACRPRATLPSRRAPLRRQSVSLPPPSSWTQPTMFCTATGVQQRFVQLGHGGEWVGAGQTGGGTGALAYALLTCNAAATLWSVPTKRPSPAQTGKPPPLHEGAEGRQEGVHTGWVPQPADVATGAWLCSSNCRHTHAVRIC